MWLTRSLCIIDLRSRWGRRAGTVAQQFVIGSAVLHFFPGFRLFLLNVPDRKSQNLPVRRRCWAFCTCCRVSLSNTGMPEIGQRRGALDLPSKQSSGRLANSFATFDQTWYITVFGGHSFVQLLFYVLRTSARSAQIGRPPRALNMCGQRPTYTISEVKHAKSPDVSRQVTR